MVNVSEIQIMEQVTETPNDIRTKRNKTMLEQIRLTNAGPAPQTSYGRASTQ